MTCDESRPRLSALLDGEADESVRAHVSGCDDCRAILDGYRRISDRMRAFDEAPAGLTDGIRRHLQRSSIPKFAAAAAMLAALLWGIVLLGNGRDSAVSPWIPAAGLSEVERRTLAGDPPTREEWAIFVLSGGDAR